MAADNDNVGPTTPLRLDVAAQMAFPGGGMTASGLRREAARGRLVIELVAGKHYTTLAAIEDMRRLCQVHPKAPACGSALNGATETERSLITQPGSSSTEPASIGRDALLAKLAKRKASSRPS